MTFHPISVAPMMKCTDRHDRNFLRTISKKVLLYTEMLTTQAIVHARDPSKLLSFEESEHPLALQIAGSDPVQIRDAVLIANSYKYDEINFNLGCPSKRVQKNNFGACLMNDYKLVSKCLKSIVDTSKAPISIKMRTGINNYTSYAFLKNFVNQISDSGCTKYIIHARNALLGSLSPKNNLKIPSAGIDIKSSEEINLNEELERAHVTPVETDLGEYIVQLAHQKPFHLLAPALHFSAQEVAELFEREIGPWG